MKAIKRVFAILLAVLTLITAFSFVCHGQEEESIAEKYKGKRVGAQSGSTYAQLVIENFPNSEHYFFSSVSDEIAALVNNKVDLVYGDMPVLRYCASQVENVKCESVGEADDFMAIIAAKTDKGREYVTQLNEYIEKITKSGELERLNAKWFDGKEEERVMEDFSTLPDTGKEIIIASEPSFPPFEYIKDDKIIGFEPEIIYGFCKEYGYTARFESVSFDGIIVGVTSGKFDLGVSGFSVTDERKKQVEFTEIIYTSGGGIAYIEEENNGGFFGGVLDRFNSTFVTENRWQMFADGLLTTFEISVISIIIGTLLGFLIHLLCRGGNKIANWIMKFIKKIIHGLPVVVFLMILFYVVFGKSNIDGKWVAIIGFALIFACSVLGMLQMGEGAVDKGQFVAARALGYSDTQTFFKIILPQAATHFLPVYADEVTSHIKATAIVGYIAVVDVTKVGDLIRGRTYDAFFPIIAVAVMYFILEWVLGLAIKLIIRQCNPQKRDMNKHFKGVSL